MNKPLIYDKDRNKFDFSFSSDAMDSLNVIPAEATAHHVDERRRDVKRQELPKEKQHKMPKYSHQSEDRNRVNKHQTTGRDARVERQRNMKKEPENETVIEDLLGRLNREKRGRSTTYQLNVKRPKHVPERQRESRA